MKNFFKKVCEWLTKKGGWITCIIILVFIGIVVLFAVNIEFAIEYPGEDFSNIFSVIGGWLGIISSIVLSLIALNINAKYRRNDEFHINNQYEFEKFKLITEQRADYIRQIKAYLLGFIEQFDYHKKIEIVDELNELYHPVVSNIRTLDLKREWKQFSDSFAISYKIIHISISTDYATEEKAKVVLSDIEKYKKELEKYNLLPDKPGEIMKLNLMKVGTYFVELCNSINEYFKVIEEDLAFVIQNKSKDYEYIKNHYIKSKEQNDGQAEHED